MADKEAKQPTRTIWVVRHGYFDDSDPRNPRVRYMVKRAQNTTTPTVMDHLDAAGIEQLISDGYTVNIS